VLRWRLTLGAVLIAALAALCWCDARAAAPGTYLAPLAIAAALLGADEMVRLSRAKGVELSRPWVLTATVLPVLATCLEVWPGPMALALLTPTALTHLGLIAGLLLLFVGELVRFDGPGAAMNRLAHAVLCLTYVGGSIGMLVQLRLLGGPLGLGLKQGAATLVPLLSLIVTVKLSDTMQYFIGRRFGRRKLAPLVSPGKTWEGAVGGIAVASLVAAAGLCVLSRGWSGVTTGLLATTWLFTATTAIAGIIGDLAESLLKRDAGVKDSSDWLPGFGGVLDILDSLLLSAPVAYAFWVLGWVPL
jgi:phosphatidate cytidylyltransferase